MKAFSAAFSASTAESYSAVSRSTMTAASVSLFIGLFMRRYNRARVTAASWSLGGRTPAVDLRAQARTTAPFAHPGVRMSRTFTYFIVAAMVLGVAVGFACNQLLDPAGAKTVAGNLGLVTDVFLRLIKMIIAPLVFTTLVAGISHMADAAAIGRNLAQAIDLVLSAS